eukprot:CAMPEP_0171306648 /NCGR_PEP_ID=MMETSP0816-20121228/16675_1 /TAXON_ID=420281 /ORGANISM="Proboscia inermis, Strain CCAP1064/1" /LENGTH=214 /DNA_ID=CAMNT_0011788369 /DNA_START=411 /DNA_END=1058 /DNA_ORIENTATION=-
MKFLSGKGNLEGKKTACHVLALIVEPISSETMKKVVDAGALKATIVMMKQFTEDWAEEHALLVNTLEYLARTHCVPEAFRELGAGEAVISSMKKCALILNVQRNGCKSLSTFVGSRRDIGHLFLLKDEKVCINAIKIVAEAMSKFPDDSLINIEGCNFFFRCISAFPDIVNKTLREIQPKSSDVLKNAELKFGQKYCDEHDGSIEFIRSLIENE